MCALEVRRINKAALEGTITQGEATNMLGFVTDFQYNQSLYGRVTRSSPSSHGQHHSHFPSAKSRQNSHAVQSHGAMSPTAALRIVVSPSEGLSLPSPNIDRRPSPASKSKDMAHFPSQSDIVLPPLDMAGARPPQLSTAAVAPSQNSPSSARGKLDERRFSVSEFSGLPSSQSSRGLPPLSPSQAVASPTQRKIPTSPSSVWEQIEASLRRASTPLEVDG